MRPGPILPEPSLSRSLRVQFNVLGALIMREMHARFGRENLGYVWLFVEPMILAGCVATLHHIAGHGLPGGLAPFPFYVLSYTPYYLLRSIVTRASTALEANAPLFYHARVRLHDVLMARTILECAAVLVALSIFLTGVGIVTGNWPRDPLGIAMGLVLMALLMHGIALLVASLGVLGAHNVDRIVHPATYLSLPASGAFFMVWWFPAEMQQMILWIPTVHIYEFVRHSYYGDVVPFHYDLLYLGAWILVTNTLGLVALRAARPHLET
ncbi:ABC transporter permease [Sabulicella glaciei]|uniref:ABC transporter permease n=1 Tax=Sabulicella glaciei TaxID=2984948 RepID=A0ABT3NUM9_9PROT|nr:ABC transporter permease [Roseococcus sp. MDT2-1-1]MCW8085874.1 ABC transporter permease [Roseococcus sp. MDT2-1-1]